MPTGKIGYAEFSASPLTPICRVVEVCLTVQSYRIFLRVDADFALFVSRMHIIALFGTIWHYFALFVP